MMPGYGLCVGTARQGRESGVDRQSCRYVRVWNSVVRLVRRNVRPKTGWRKAALMKTETCVQNNIRSSSAGIATRNGMDGPGI